MTCVAPDADTVNRWFVAPVRDASPAWAVLPADAGERDDRPPVATGLEPLRDLLRDGLWHDRIIPRDIGDDTVTAMITAILEPVLTTQLGFTMHCRMQPMGTTSCTRLLLRHPKDGAAILDYGITRTGDGCRWSGGRPPPRSWLGHPWMPHIVPGIRSRRPAGAACGILKRRRPP